MPNSKKSIYQFKITLVGCKPKIWRRIEVPENYKFSDLHDAIQDAMGWENCHLHEFRIFSSKTGRDERIGLQFTDPVDSEIDILDEAQIKISQYFSILNKNAKYKYDFGDDWEHQILLEKILFAEDGITYPRCIAGKNACPPEDCGGIWGYELMLEILKDPNHPEFKERIEWLGEGFDPEEFNPKSIIFHRAKS